MLKLQNIPKNLITSIAIGSIAMLTVGILITNLNKEKNKDTEPKIEQVKKQPTTVDEFSEQIEEYANQINIPHSINYEELPGGYVLAQITYSPNNEDKNDNWSIPVLKRIREEAASDSPEAQALTQKFKDALPNISNTVQTTQPELTTIETFEQDGSYYSVFSYDNKPYAYIYTKDGKSTSVINEYYFDGAPLLIKLDKNI